MPEGEPRSAASGNPAISFARIPIAGMENIRARLSRTVPRNRECAMLRYWIFLAFSTAVLSSPPAADRSPAQPLEPVVHAVLFTSPICSFCRGIVEEELPPVLEKFGGRLDILYVDVDTAAGQDLYRTFLETFQVTGGVPLIVIQDVVLGGINIPKNLPDVVNEFLAQQGADWPDIPGLEEYRNAARTPHTPTVTPPARGMLESAGTGGAFQSLREIDAAIRPTVRGILFYSPTCEHCHIVQSEVLPPLQERYGDQLQIAAVDTSTPAGRSTFDFVIAYFHAETAGVPFLVIGDRFLVGSVEIPEQLPGLIEQYLAQGGADWPAIPGLMELLETAGTTGAATAVPEPGWIERLRDRLVRDPAGNAVSILVLAGMVVSFLAAAVQRRKPSDHRPARVPAWVIPALCILGLCVAGYLTYVEIGRVEAVCGPVGDCNTVQQSEYARLFGVLPVGALGICGYILILAAWFLGRTSGGRWNNLADLGIFGLSAFGFLFSVYLTFLEPFVIGASCLWCLASAVLMTILFRISLPPGRAALSALAEKAKQRTSGVDIMEIPPAIRRRIIAFQRQETTEYHIYRELARTDRNPENRRVLDRIAKDELRHAGDWKQYTGVDAAPDWWAIVKFRLISRLLGITFAVKQMENGEVQAQKNYADLRTVVPEIDAWILDEDSHERSLLEMIDEERLHYMGSVVLGLNDALVELTGALAGYTLALQNTRLIALTGLITGIAAALSMAASEYLSIRAEKNAQHPVRAAVYTGITYILTVALLITPYLLFGDYLLDLALALLSAVLVIAAFNYYLSVTKGESFRARFLEMAGISMGVAGISFLIGYAVRQLLGVEI
jgi:VIT1/CCC1 family predicted Fe2+/Mn2+ transporter/uncharacterized membrane protein/thiol-disulfide isomerase/thioredoxin